MTRRPLQLARNIDGGTEKGTASPSIVWTHNTVHSTRGTTLSAQSHALGRARHCPARDVHTSHATLCGVKGSRRVRFLRTATGPSLLDRHATVRFHQARLSPTAGNSHTGPARDRDIDYLRSHEWKGLQPKGRQASLRPTARTRHGSRPHRQASGQPRPRRPQPALPPVPLPLPPGSSSWNDRPDSILALRQHPALSDETRALRVRPHVTRGHDIRAHSGEQHRGAREPPRHTSGST